MPTTELNYLLLKSDTSSNTELKSQIECYRSPQLNLIPVQILTLNITPNPKQNVIKWNVITYILL